MPTYQPAPDWQHKAGFSVLVQDGVIGYSLGEGAPVCVEDGFAMVFDLLRGEYHCPSCATSAIIWVADATI